MNIIADVAVASGQNAKARNPKLFFVSSTTSTISTTTLCYMDATTKAACGRRKRRRAVIFDSLNMDGVTRVTADDRQVQLTQELLMCFKIDLVSHNFPGQAKHFGSKHPQSRFLLYYVFFRSADESEVENGHESMKGTNKENEREGKFRLYWMTTTSTSTTYTATTTLSSLECTPIGFTISTCTG